MSVTLAACGARSPLEAGQVPSPVPEPTTSVDPGVPPAPSAPPVPPMTPMQPARPCESLSLTIDELRPSVTLLVDQSGSMNRGYPRLDSAATRWTLVRDALLDPKLGVVSELQASIQFGVSFYTSYNGFSGGDCPAMSEVTSATQNYGAIRALYDGTFPADDTPTGAAIERVVSRLQTSAHSGPEVLLLVTDGDPDTCSQPDPQDGQDEAVRAAAHAHAAGIDFYVLGISSDISGDKLQQLANAGQGKPLDATWGKDPNAARPYQANGGVAELTAELRQILERVPLCQVELERDVALDELSSGSVTLDGQELQLGSPDGFRLEDARHLSILGNACKSLRQTGRLLSVAISCER